MAGARANEPPLKVHERSFMDLSYFLWLPPKGQWELTRIEKVARDRVKPSL